MNREERGLLPTWIAFVHLIVGTRHDDDDEDDDDEDDDDDDQWFSGGVCVSAQPDGCLLATGYESGDICVWSPEGSLVSRLQASETSVICLGFSVSGSRLAAACADGKVVVWSVYPPQSAAAAAPALGTDAAATDAATAAATTATAAGDGMSPWEGQQQGDGERAEGSDGWRFVLTLSYKHTSEELLMILVCLPLEAAVSPCLALSLSLHICLSVSLSLSVSPCISVSISLCLSLSPSVIDLLSLYFSLSVSISVYFNRSPYLSLSVSSLSCISVAFLRMLLLLVLPPYCCLLNVARVPVAYLEEDEGY